MNKKKGFTLIELMVVIAIIGIVASIAIPNFSDMIQRNRLKGAVKALETDLQWMRTQSIKQSCNLQASFITGDSSTWSYKIYQPAAELCPSCTAGANCVLKTITGTEFAGVTMAAPSFLSAPTTVAEFDFRRGEARRVNNSYSNGGVTLSTTTYTARVVIAQSGHVRICTPSSTTGLTATPSCP